LSSYKIAVRFDNYKKSICNRHNITTRLIIKTIITPLYAFRHITPLPVGRGKPLAARGRGFSL